MSIQIGDRVDIFWDQITPEMDVRVVGLPYNTGDSWVVERLDGTIVYVQLFGKMVRR